MPAAVTLSKEARAGMDAPTARAVERVMTAIRDTCHARYALIALDREVTPDDAPELVRAGGVAGGATRSASVRAGLAAWEATTLQLAWDNRQPQLTRSVLVGMYRTSREEITAHIEAMARNMAGGAPSA